MSFSHCLVELVLGGCGVFDNMQSSHSDLGTWHCTHTMTMDRLHSTEGHSSQAQDAPGKYAEYKPTMEILFKSFMERRSSRVGRSRGIYTACRAW